jgi:hypothetical protein
VAAIKAFHGTVVAGVGGNSHHLAPGFGGEFGGRGSQLLGAARRDHQIDTLKRQLPGDGLADALAAACNQSPLTSELKVHLQVSIPLSVKN